jgi:molybdopterin synthase sulfur carrier subunit
MKIHYFAWLRTKTGVTQRGPGFAEALADLNVVRVAVNQEYVALDHPVRPGDEVALFPPVTGG